MFKITIAIPTYNRPELLGRCLDKLIYALGQNTEDFEVIVGDDSALLENEILLNNFQKTWGGMCRYLKHSKPLGQQGNFNDLIAHATGRFIQFVHDDDYLLPNAGHFLLQAAHAHGERPDPILFATVLVGLDEVAGKREGTTRNGYLNPQDAVRKLLSKSSFIRFPAMLVPRLSYLAIGGFDSKEAIPDWPVWLKLAEQFGISLRPDITNAYTIHEAAGTSKTFKIEFMIYLINLLNRYQNAAAWSPHQMQIALGEFIHRYILAGCLRSIRQYNFDEYQSRFNLFLHPMISTLPCPFRWKPLKLLAFLINKLVNLVNCTSRTFHKTT